LQKHQIISDAHAVYLSKPKNQTIKKLYLLAIATIDLTHSITPLNAWL